MEVAFPSFSSSFIYSFFSIPCRLHVFISGSTDRTIREWELPAGQPACSLEAPGGKMVWCVTATRDGSVFAAGLGDGRVILV